MPALQPLVTLSEEIQDVTCFVDGAGIAFVATARTNGQAIHVYKVQGSMVTPLADATPPPQSGQYSVSLQASGPDLILVATGHYLDAAAPRRNVICQARYPGVVTPLRADPFHAAGAFTAAVPPPVTPPPSSGPSATEIADAVRARMIADLGGDSLRHGLGPLVQSASSAALQEAFAAGGIVQQSPGLYQRLKDTVYEVLKGGGIVK
jgi:hypothetical protein